MSTFTVRSAVGIVSYQRVFLMPDYSHQVGAKCSQELRNKSQKPVGMVYYLPVEGYSLIVLKSERFQFEYKLCGRPKNVFVYFEQDLKTQPSVFGRS